MAKEQKIYVVTSGEYSDYHIDAVFTDEKLAKEFADRDPEYMVEEYTANEKFEVPNRWWSVTIWGDNRRETHVCRSTRAFDTVEVFTKGNYTFTVKAQGMEKARAIALERYHAFLAVKDTHFPFIDKPYQSGENRSHETYYYYLTYGYFDYKAYYDINHVSLIEAYEYLMTNIGKEIGSRLTDELMLAELKACGIDLHPDTEFERCSIYD